MGGVTMRVLHSSDWHWSNDHIDRCCSSALFVVSTAERLEPDLHIISGDWWDRRTMVGSVAFLSSIKTLIALAAVCPVVIIDGNEAHDAEGSVAWLKHLNTVHPILTSTRPESYFVIGDDFVSAQDSPKARARAIVHTFPYPTKAYFLAGKTPTSIDATNKAIQDALRGLFMGFGALSTSSRIPAIFVGHCNVTGASLSTGQVLLGQDIMVSKHDLALAECDYYALGHIHKAQAVAPMMWYAGSTYHCNFGETEKKQIHLITFPDDTIEHFNIPSRPLSLHEMGYDPHTQTFRDMDPQERWGDWVGADLRVRVHLTREQNGTLMDKTIMDYYHDAATVKVERIVMPDERVRSTEIITCNTLPDKVNEWGKTTNQKIPRPVIELARDIEERQNNDRA
jgi:DNA repair protein SbcD/Mre11